MLIFSLIFVITERDNNHFHQTTLLLICSDVTFQISYHKLTVSFSVKYHFRHLCGSKGNPRLPILRLDSPAMVGIESIPLKEFLPLKLCSEKKKKLI